MEKIYTISEKKIKGQGVDCGSDYEFLITKLRVKLKKVGKTTRPFRYNLNQIPYDYTMEVTNSYTISNFHHQYVRVPIFPHPRQYLFYLTFQL